MKRVNIIRKLALAMVMVMVFVSVGTWVNVENAYAADSDWTISTNDTGVTIVKYNGSDADITIPSTINGSKVTQIGNGSYDIFYRKESSVTSVTLPQQNVILNKNAFNGCSNITTVNNSEYVTEIGVGCFAGCTNLTGFKFSDSITGLGDSSFRNTGLKEVVLPANVTFLRLYVFGNCSSLTKVTVLNSELAYKDNTIFSGSSVTLYAAAGSTTETYASANGHGFVVYTGDSGGTGGDSGESGGSGGSGGEGDITGGSDTCDHNWVFKSLKQTATCVQERAENQKCTRCGATRVYTYSGTMIAHKMSDYTIVVSPSATRNGYKVATCSMCGYEDKVILPAYGSGTTTVIYGDCNGNSVVDTADAVMIKQHLASMSVNIDMDASDVNADGVVNISDAVKLMKHLAGVEGVELGKA
ncbi:MAG: leucine-rich repeat protein [Lachnospira sp.]|nr:leucine-rich repeat protein [Lachnospira sp.]